MRSSYILVVEDSPDIRDLVGQVFEGEGYEVELARDGREALATLRARETLPYFILLDLMMPVMNGTQFREEQLKDERLAHVPVLLMSADSHVEERTAVVGANGYLRKPVDIDVLLAAAAKYAGAPKDPYAARELAGPPPL